MKLGFVSAILPDLSMEEVVQFAGEEGYDCVEMMCWPVSKAERRYAGVTHVDVTQLDQAKADAILETCDAAKVEISALGYYPNPLTPDEQESQVAVEHIKKLMLGARLLGLTQVNSFVGRDWTKNVDDNWPRFKSIWGDLIKFAEDQGVRVGIENCPMFFSNDEWPGGKNLATTPSIWRRMYEEIPSLNFGLNYDPSHMIWQQMDYLNPLTNFADRIFHVHAKDVRIDRQRLDDVGIMANPSEYHTPKLPGFGDVDWGKFFSALTDTLYAGSVCVEVEDRAYESSLELRKASLRQSHTYLRNFIPKVS